MKARWASILNKQPKGQGFRRHAKSGRDCGEDTDPPVLPFDSIESGTASSSNSEDESGDDATLWCRKATWSHGELLDWGVSRCPACRQKFKNSKPRPKAHAPKTKDARTAASTEPTARRRAKVRYSNKFLWGNGKEMFSEPWPDLLDLDRDRGKLAMSQRPSDEPVIEIVTTVATNLTFTSRPRRSTKWTISNTSLGTECVGKEVVIRSRRVLDALGSLITYYPKIDLGVLSLRISQPYALFYHYIDEIKAFQNTYHRAQEDPSPASNSVNFKGCDEETCNHLDIVREFIEGENLVEVREEISRHRQQPAVATYAMLWLLFKPGTKVYVRRMGMPVSAGVVLSIQGGDLSPGESDPFSVDYWTLEFDGTRLGRCPHNFIIKPFAGERKISELEVSPCSYYDTEDSGMLRETLITRGRKYWRFLPGVQVDYDGKLPEDQSEWRGRVMVDPMTYNRYADSDTDYPPVLREILASPTVGNIQDSKYETHSPIGPPGYRPPLPPTERWPKSPYEPKDPSQKWQFEGPQRKESGPWAEYDNIIPGPDNRSLELIEKVTGKTDTSRYLLCPPYVIGFDLKARQWQMFDVSCCDDVAPNHSAIDNLVMREERKSVIKSLVHRYSAVDSASDGSQIPKPWTADFIKNKGEGQIFLLHGSPGVGKTYTSECIAEATGRPLLSLTCGDIGTNEVTAERKLSKWFRLAEIWGAVMLLDEADVFLEKRSVSDLQRNSLVSVFLRIVEYYRGILFLTTNRVGQFDDAFISRIHTVIHYENFSRSEQDRIWAQFFTKLEEQRRKDIRVHPSAREYISDNKSLRMIEWNGRQIRNAFQTAVAFAEYRFLQTKPESRYEGEKASLEDKDFAKVCEMTIAFQEYMASVHGGDESKRARLERIRDDKFKEG